jgi:GNAT superfamily N-acetyltransferase
VQSTPHYRISNDRAQLDVAMIHQFLSQESSWAQTVPRPIVERAIARSLCFGLYQADRQLGFARVVTDAATFGYLADVFIVASHRGLGLGRRLLEAVVAHPDLQGLTRFMLATRDAHEVFRQFGFIAPSHPELLMEQHTPPMPAAAVG